MPIEFGIPLRPLENDEFRRIDYHVMGCAYTAQNELGRLCDERVYENEIARQLKCKGGHKVSTQVPIQVSFHSFLKTYYLDLVVDGMVYELKTVSSLSPEHDAQAINYAAMVPASMAKLVNLRTRKVQGKLVRAPNNTNHVYLKIIDFNWHPKTPECKILLSLLKDLVSDVGGLLATELYRDALRHSCDDRNGNLIRAAICREGVNLGTQEYSVNSRGIPFVVTTLREDMDHHETQFRNQLRFTELPCLHWMNICQDTLTAVTIDNKD